MQNILNSLQYCNKKRRYFQRFVYLPVKIINPKFSLLLEFKIQKSQCLWDLGLNLMKILVGKLWFNFEST